MKLISAALMLLAMFCTHFSNAQVRELYDQLDLTDVTTKFFLPQAYTLPEIPNPLSYDDTLSFDDAAQLFSNFSMAYLDDDIVL